MFVLLKHVEKCQVLLQGRTTTTDAAEGGRQRVGRAFIAEACSGETRGEKA